MEPLETKSKKIVYISEIYMELLNFKISGSQRNI